MDLFGAAHRAQMRALAASRGHNFRTAISLVSGSERRNRTVPTSEIQWILGLVKKPAFDADDTWIYETLGKSRHLGPLGAALILTQGTSQAVVTDLQAVFVKSALRNARRRQQAAASDATHAGWVEIILRSDARLAKSFGVDAPLMIAEQQELLSFGSSKSQMSRAKMARNIFCDEDFVAWVKSDTGMSHATAEEKLRAIVTPKIRDKVVVDQSKVLYSYKRELEDLALTEAKSDLAQLKCRECVLRGIRVAKFFLQNDWISISPSETLGIGNQLLLLAEHPFADDKLRRAALNVYETCFSSAQTASGQSRVPKLNSAPSWGDVASAEAYGRPDIALKAAQQLLRKLVKAADSTKAGVVFDLIDFRIPLLEFESTAAKLLRENDSSGPTLSGSPKTVIAWAGFREASRAHPVVAYAQLQRSGYRLRLYGKFHYVCSEARKSFGLKSSATGRFPLSMLAGADTWNDVLLRLAPDAETIHFVREWLSINRRRHVGHEIPESESRAAVRALLRSEEIWQCVRADLLTHNHEAQAVVNDIHTLPSSLVSARIERFFGKRVRLLHTSVAYDPLKPTRDAEVYEIVLDTLADGRRSAIFPKRQLVAEELLKIAPEAPEAPKAKFRRRNPEEPLGSVGLLGKLSFDLGMRKAGGPAHEDLQDWLIHTVEVAIRACRRVEIRPHPEEYRQEVRFFSRESMVDLLPDELRSRVRVCSPTDEPLSEFASRNELLVTYESSAVVDLALAGRAVVSAVWSAPRDYGFGCHLPATREEYEEIVSGNFVPVADDYIAERAGAWLSAIRSQKHVFSYRFHSQQGTNLHRKPAAWNETALSEMFFIGDSEVNRIAERITDQG